MSSLSWTARTWPASTTFSRRSRAAYGPRAGRSTRRLASGRRPRPESGLVASSVTSISPDRPFTARSGGRTGCPDCLRRVGRGLECSCEQRQHELQRAADPAERPVVSGTQARLLLERVPTTIFRAAKGLGRPSHLRATLADRPVEVARDRILEVERALAHATCEVEVDIVQMDVLDPTRGQLDHLDRVGPRDHEVGDVQADTSLGAHQQPFDLLRPLNDAAKPGLHGELEPVPRAHVLDR